jgi:hypothetical protein
MISPSPVWVQTNKQINQQEIKERTNSSHSFVKYLANKGSGICIIFKKGVPGEVHFIILIGKLIYSLMFWTV